MARFDFECKEHGVFEVVLKAASLGAKCPTCGVEAEWRPGWGGGFKFTFRDGFDACTGEYHPTKRHYEECKRRKGLVKVD